MVVAAPEIFSGCVAGRRLPRHAWAIEPDDLPAPPADLSPTRRWADPAVLAPALHPGVHPEVVARLARAMLLAEQGTGNRQRARLACRDRTPALTSPCAGEGHVEHLQIQVSAKGRSQSVRRRPSHQGNGQVHGRHRQADHLVGNLRTRQTENTAPRHIRRKLSHCTPHQRITDPCRQQYLSLQHAADAAAAPGTARHSPSPGGQVTSPRQARDGPCRRGRRCPAVARRVVETTQGIVVG